MVISHSTHTHTQSQVLTLARQMFKRVLVGYPYVCVCVQRQHEEKDR